LGPGPVVRPLRPTDLVMLPSFWRDGDRRELTVPPWPRVCPEGGDLSLGSLFAAAVAQPSIRARLWVAVDGGAIVGVARGRPRSQGLVWDVSHLYVRAGSEDVVQTLLDRVCQQALSEGARRVFLELRPDVCDEAVRRAGFTRYCAREFYVLREGVAVQPGAPLAGRRRSQRDEVPLFLLYNAAVPLPVRTAEAMTREEWTALYRGRYQRSPSLLRECQQYVWDADDAVVGWAELLVGQRGQCFEILVHPRWEDRTEGMVRFALAKCSPRTPVFTVAREYQATLRERLDAMGFEALATGKMYVRQLASRSAQPSLAPAVARLC